MTRELLRTLWPFGRRAREDRAACRVLFVCTANLCRSPSAEAVFRHKLQAAGLDREVACASAATHDVGLGRRPDGRARAAAERRGYDMSRARWRLLEADDFERFDLMLAMERQNLDAMRERCPPDKAQRLRLLTEFSGSHRGRDVPDPYYGNAKAFEVVLDVIEEACDGLLEHVRTHYLPAQTESADAATAAAGEAYQRAANSRSSGEGQ